MPGLSPDWFANVMQSIGGAGGAPAPSHQPWYWGDSPNPAPMPGPQGGGLSPDVQNVIQALAQGGQAAPGFSPDGAPAPRQRHSILDTIGRISDVLAKVGGADALYQPTLDARQDRQFAIEDRQRGIDMDAIKKAQAQLGIQQSQQQLIAGQNSLDDYGRAKIGQAVKGLQAIQAGGGDVGAALPSIAQQLGLNPDEVKSLGDALASDPSLAGLSAALNGQTKDYSLNPFYAQDSTGNVQAYQLGKDGSIRQVQLPNGFSPVGQLTQVDTGDARVLVDKRTGQPVRRFVQSGGPDKGSRPVVDAQGNVVAYEPIPGSARADSAGKAAALLTPTQRGNVVQNYQMLPSLYQQWQRTKQLSDQLKTGTVGKGYLGGMIPGAVLGGVADQYDKSEALLRQMLRRFTRTPGEGSFSDYETRLLGATIPTRSDSVEGRDEALSNLRNLILQTRKGYADLLRGGQRSPVPDKQRTTPVTPKPSGGGWGKATVVK